MAGNSSASSSFIGVAGPESPNDDNVLVGPRTPWYCTVHEGVPRLFDYSGVVTSGCISNERPFYEIFPTGSVGQWLIEETRRGAQKQVLRSKCSEASAQRSVSDSGLFWRAAGKSRAKRDVGGGACSVIIIIE